MLIGDPNRLDGVAVIGADDHCWRHTRRGEKYVTVIIDLTAEYLMSSDKPFTLVRGGPGQGKSTLGQYLSHVYRPEFIPDEPTADTKVQP